ncbi:MAG TPA: SAM-dependent methyltransferase [Rhizomicrobium sp.]|jgi:methyltransferase (TIGR00027 family)
MEDNRPSRTAQGAAAHRAAHQLLDIPPVFGDPLALKIIGREAETELRQALIRIRTERAGLRAFIAARSRFSEDTLAEAVSQGVSQYVLLGAGLDTFAYRGAKAFPGLSVFEVDHPATQGWKRERLADAGIAVPGALTYAPVNFETETLSEGLMRAGFDTKSPAVFAWLGVVPYLTRDAIMATLGFIAGLPQGTTVIFDYGEPPSERDTAAATAHREMAERVAASGEPFRSFFKAEDLARDVAAIGFSTVEDFDAGTLNARYFAGRDDDLRLRGAGHLMRARV